MTEALQQEIRALRALYQSERDPEGLAFATLADAHRRAGELPEATRLLNDGLARHPDFVTGHVVAARLYVDQGKHQEAGLAAHSALQLDDENVEALRVLLVVAEADGATSMVDELRDRLEALDPGGEGAAIGAPTVDRGYEDVVALEDLAPDSDPVVDIAALMPVGGGQAETVLDIAALGPSRFEEEVESMTDEPVYDLQALAPDALPGDSDDVSEEERVVSLDSLAPGGVPANPVLEVSALAPSVVEDALGRQGEEPTFELDTLATSSETVADSVAVASLAPDPLLDIAALGPDAARAVDDDGGDPGQPLYTRTLGELYVKQGALGEALDVFRHLLELHPGDETLRQRIQEIEAGPKGTPVPAGGGEDEHEVEALAKDLAASGEDTHDVESPFAWGTVDLDGVAKGGPTIGQYFEKLLGWEPGEDR